MVKSKYIDIIDTVVDAYTDQRIRDYVAQVKAEGLSEHGFPRPFPATAKRAMSSR